MSLSPPPLLLLLLPFPWMGKSVVKSSSVLSQITRKIPTKKKQGNAFFVKFGQKERTLHKKPHLNRSIDRSIRSIVGLRFGKKKKKQARREILSLCLCVCVCVCARVIDRRIFYSIFGERKKERADICCLEIEKPKEEIVEK